MQADYLSLTFAALADPTRRAILARLAEGEATVNQLAEPFELKLPTVSKHLKVLQRAGLVSQSRQAQWRPCRLEPAPLERGRGLGRELHGASGPSGSASWTPISSNFKKKEKTP